MQLNVIFFQVVDDGGSDRSFPAKDSFKQSLISLSVMFGSSLPRHIPTFCSVCDGVHVCLSVGGRRDLF